MPVSPQDFALWSRMTGNPVPRTPAEQMMLAPQVYQFNRQLGQGQNPLQSAAESISSTIDKVGKAALGLGVLTGAGLLGVKAFRNLPDRTVTEDAKVEEPAEKVADTPSFWETQAAKLAAKEKPALAEEVREAAAPSPKELLSSTVSELRKQEPVEITETAASSGVEPEDVVKVTQVEVPSKGISSEAIVQAVQAAKGRTPAERRASRLAEAPDFGDAEKILPEDLALYKQHVKSVHRRGVSERAQQFLNRLGLDDEVAVDNDIIAANPGSNTALASQDVTSADPASAIGQRISSNQTGAAVAERSAAAPKQTVASKLSQQQSVVHLDEDDDELVGAAPPGATEAYKKGRQYQEMKQRYEGLQDIASPSTEGVSSSSILPSAPPQATVGERLRSAGYGRQGVPVALGGEGVELYSEGLEKGIGLNTPAGLAALERAGVTPEEAEQSWVKQLRESGALPAAEPSAAAAVEVSAPRRTAAQPAPRGASPAEVAEYDAALARGMSTTPQAERIAIRNRHFEKKYGAAPAVVTEQAQVAKPAGVAVVPFLKEKAAAVRPKRIEPGAMRDLMSQAEQYEGALTTPAGAEVYKNPYRDVENPRQVDELRMYGGGNIGVKWQSTPGVEYAYQTTPETYSLLQGIAQAGEFGKQGVSDFITAGRNYGDIRSITGAEGMTRGEVQQLRGLSEAQRLKKYGYPGA